MNAYQFNNGVIRADRRFGMLRRNEVLNADDDGVLGRCHVEPDHVGGFGDERGIVALAPGFAPGEVDLLRAQKTPDSTFQCSPNNK